MSRSLSEHRSQELKAALVILALVVVSAALLAAGGLFLASARTGRPLAAGQASRVYTREEFKAAVMGKTEAEVIAGVGKPDRTDGAGMWVYHNRTKDPLTGKIDFATNVFFKDGKVHNILF